MIPQHLTHAEVGIFLQAVGKQMESRDLCFEAAMDGNSYEEILEDIVAGLPYDPPDPRTRAAELIQLTGEEAVNFNFVEGFR